MTALLQTCLFAAVSIRCIAQTVHTSGGDIDANAPSEAFDVNSVRDLDTSSEVYIGGVPPVQPWPGVTQGTYSVVQDWTKTYLRDPMPEKVEFTPGPAEDGIGCTWDAAYAPKFGYASKYAAAAAVNAAKITSLPPGRRVLQLDGLCDVANRAWNSKYFACKKEPGELQAEIDPMMRTMATLRYVDERGTEVSAPTVECKFQAISLFNHSLSSQVHLPVIGVRLDFYSCTPIDKGLEAATVIYGFAPATEEEIRLANLYGADYCDQTLPAAGCVWCNSTKKYMPSWKARATCVDHTTGDANAHPASNTLSDSGVSAPHTYNFMNAKNFFTDVCRAGGPLGGNENSFNFQALVLGNTTGPPNTLAKCFARSATMAQLSPSQNFPSCFKDVVEFTMQDAQGGMALMPVPVQDWQALLALIEPAKPAIENGNVPPKVPATIAVDRVCVDMPTCKCQTSCSRQYSTFKNGADYTTTILTTSPASFEERMASDKCNKCWPLELVIALSCAFVTAISARGAMILRRVFEMGHRNQIEFKAVETMDLGDNKQSDTHHPPGAGGSQELPVFNQKGDKSVFLIALPVLLFSVSFLWTTAIKVLSRTASNDWTEKHLYPRECPCESILPYQMACFVICWFTTVWIAMNQKISMQTEYQMNSMVWMEGE